ncbi:hypothetical protein [Spirosoma arcticum]
MNVFLNYYGLDWLAMVLSLLALWLIGNKNRVGFAAFALANITWIVVGIWLMHSLGIVLGNLVFLAMNVRGYVNWKKPQTDGHLI